jgi:hypothetical protein
MAKDKQVIINEIKSHIQKEGSGYKAWYVGMSRDPRNRLFKDHNVSEENSWWIIREAASSTAAREIESYFVNKLGTDGGTGGGDSSSKYVYAYKKTSSTNP